MHAPWQRYGAGPVHLLALIASFALAGVAAWSLVASKPIAVVVWFVGAAVVHDVVLLPLYALVDRLLPRPSAARPPATWINYIRIPGGISLLLLLVFLPSIARLSDVYTPTTGLSASGYLVRWLAVTGVLFALSALILVLRHGLVRRR